jgi:ABC-type Na+ efflux pump permease subunit
MKRFLPAVFLCVSVVGCDMPSSSKEKSLASDLILVNKADRAEVENTAISYLSKVDSAVGDPRKAIENVSLSVEKSNSSPVKETAVVNFKNELDNQTHRASVTLQKISGKWEVVGSTLTSQSKVSGNN